MEHASTFCAGLLQDGLSIFSESLDISGLDGICNTFINI